jgi:hypothetical protein
VTSKNQSNAVCLCPLDGIIDTIGKKWGLLIINEIGNHERLRYNKLMSELKGISPSTLASMLKEFEKEHKISTETFVNKFNKGELGDDKKWFEWIFAYKAYNHIQDKISIMKGITI